ncbi:hypothetical protein RRG08_043808 [Elysia crispata]|uniref:Uncharacterized protein n=1 Tax=Elysia crispata TaxID=231223 RepID=A0AAE0Z620_9GAST|nr:hypothetical protein RRG08_043808 [Elysia crispata]
MLAIWIREITGHHDVCHMEKRHHDVGHKDKKAYWTLRCWPYGRDRIQKTIMLAMWKRENTGHHHVRSRDNILLLTTSLGVHFYMPQILEMANKDGIIKEDTNLRNAMESENEYGLNLISKRDFGNGEGGGFGQKNNVQWIFR